MVDTTKYLVENTHAALGYTQSDEISLCWNLDLEENPEAQYMFDGKFQKLTSVLASMAGAYFCRELGKRIPEKSEALPVFDARVWNVPNLNDVYLNFLWRQDDCIKNSISMAAQAHFSSKELHGVGSEDKKKMLRLTGLPWEDEPRFFKTGTFVRRNSKWLEMSPEQLNQIPEQFRPAGLVLRSVVEEMDIGYIKNDNFDFCIKLK
jgi:tRNA(His) 5'-end guanylyltransferase